jgi:hypothetical protein
LAALSKAPKIAIAAVTPAINIIHGSTNKVLFPINLNAIAVFPA